MKKLLTILLSQFCFFFCLYLNLYSGTVHPEIYNFKNIKLNNLAKPGTRYVQSLAGYWQFKLDPEKTGLAEAWYKTDLPEKIELPGSTEQRGFGHKTSLPGVKSTNSKKPEAFPPNQGLTEPRVGRLTRLITYEGPAWYQREITVPEKWKGKRVELFLERCHWETTVWVDGQKLSSANSLSTPHIHNLGILIPGKHKLTICVDNTLKLPIGSWAHAITEDTQGNWNGIIGRIELRATDPVWIINVKVFPDSLKVHVGNSTGKFQKAKIHGFDVKIPQNGGVVSIPFKDTNPVWDEFKPLTNNLTVKLEAGKYHDIVQVNYGIRKLSISNKQFLMNDRPVFMRGSVDCSIYPLTGYPPMDKESWLRVIGIYQSYGFNFMRFHSWCPPLAAFEAADELGFLLQIELPLWTMDVPQYGKHPLRDQWLRDELYRILDTYGNHPSFGFMAMGNESSGSLEELVLAGRKYDHRMLYRCENGNDEAHGDYFETGQRGVLGPRTDWDRSSLASGWIAGGSEKNQSEMASVPTFSHEVGSWVMYPDFDEIKKYTGTLRAYNFESYKESLTSHHMLDQNKDFAKASGKFSVSLFKDEIEASLRTFPYGGMQLLQAQDYPGQGTAIVGWLDAFWDSKGLISPEEFRRFCATTVCLLRMPKRVLTTAEIFSAKAEIAHYGAANIDVKPIWALTDEKGNKIAEGTLPGAKVITGGVTKLGDISISLKKIDAPQRLIVTVSAAGTSNSWNIWVYPSSQPEAPNNVRIAHAFDQATINALENGERVLLFSSPKEGVINPVRMMATPDSLLRFKPVKPGANAIPGSFMPTFWCLRLFNQIGTLGILCNPNHLALAKFPTEFHSDLQWADLLGRFSAGYSLMAAGADVNTYTSMENAAGDVSERSKAIILDETPADYRPIVQVIDNYERNSKLGVVFETSVGKGKLLVCAMDLDIDAEKRPAARQLRQSLLEYASGNQFNPSHELPLALLERLLTVKQK